MKYQNYDFESLRGELMRQCRGAYFGGGFGAAMVDEQNIRRASDSSLLQYARELGVDPNNYRIPDDPDEDLFEDPDDDAQDDD